MLTIEELREQVRSLKEAKGFDVTLEQRLAYLTAEVGEVSKEVLGLRGFGPSGDARYEDPREVSERLGMEIYDVVWNLLDLADLAGVEDLEGAFAKKAALNEGRVWSRTGGGPIGGSS